MKSFFKRSAISMIVLGITGSAYAAVPNNPNNWSNWSPQYSGVFLGVEGLYLEPRNGDLDYVTVIPSSPGESFTTSNINTDYDWSWRIYGGIKFTENDDITLSWLQSNESDNEHLALAGTESDVLSAPRFHFIFPWDNITGHASFDLDDAYLVWGHTIHFNNPWSVRFAAGLEYAKIDSDLRVTANDTEADLPIGYTGFEAKSDTKGFGPRVEFDMIYGFGCGFNAFANFNAALLVSSRDVSLNPVVPSVTITDEEEGETTTFDFFSSDYSKRHVVIPKFGARLGVGYTYIFGQAGAEGCGTALTINVGWQVESYIHAIERPSDGFSDVTFDEEPIPPALQQEPETLFGAFNHTKTSNFGDQGPFIGIQVSTGWL
jgi:hypothetical protein